MTKPELLLLSKALDGLWGAIDATGSMCELLVDHQDGRLESMNRAMVKAQDAIIALNESLGIERH